ncbi:phosphotransferase enzyme family protein [Streptomyces sp. NPDC001275]
MGLNPHQAELVRLGENAIYALPSDEVVVRVARSDTADTEAKVTKELAVSRWLASHGFPGIRARDDLPQPVQVQGRLVTFWEYIPPSQKEPDLIDLAGLLRSLHALPKPDFAVPALDPFPIMRHRLACADGIKSKYVQFLSDACDRAEPAFRTIMKSEDQGLIHGDAHRGNLLVHDERALLIDYEAVAVGPLAWDLIPTATAVDRFGLPHTEYAAFCRTYGWDVTKWHGYKELRTVRELGMTTWLMQNAQTGTHAEEFALRVQCLWEEDRERRWNAL